MVVQTQRKVWIHFCIVILWLRSKKKLKINKSFDKIPIFIWLIWDVRIYFSCRDKIFSSDANLNIMLFGGCSKFSVEKELKHPRIYAVFHDFMAVAKCLNSRERDCNGICLPKLPSEFTYFQQFKPLSYFTRHSITVYDEVNIQLKFQIQFDLFIASPSYSPSIGTKLRRWVKILLKLSPKSLH